jgi:hypothetical protein
MQKEATWRHRKFQPRGTARAMDNSLIFLAALFASFAQNSSSDDATD